MISKQKAAGKVREGITAVFLAFPLGESGGVADDRGL